MPWPNSARQSHGPALTGPYVFSTDLDDLKWVVLMVLFNQPGAEAAYAWMETQMFVDEPEPLH